MTFMHKDSRAAPNSVPRKVSMCVFKMYEVGESGPFSGCA
jgi:hypothetical protein